MHPAPLLARRRKNLLQRGPEPHGPVAGGQFRSGEPTCLEAEKHFAPALRAFANTVFDGKKMLLAPCVNANDNEHAEPVIRAAQPAVNAIRPDIDPFVSAQIGLAPVVVLCCPLALQARNGLGRKSSGLKGQAAF